MKKKQDRSRRMLFESLERREMMAVSASLNKAGTLTIKGTKNADSISFMQTDGTIYASGVKKGVWDANKVHSIVVDLGKGNDTVSFRSLTNGGNQALAEPLTILTKTKKAGVDTVRLADGHDLTLNGNGHTVYVNSTGATWLNGVQQNWNPPAPPNPSPNPPSPNPPTPPTPQPTTWFDSHVIDTAIKSLGSSLYVDGLIDRNDMIALLRSAQDSNAVDATELSDLRAIVSNTTLFGTAEHVWKLGTYIVSANNANATYNGQSLGNLAAGSSGVHLEKLIGKWYLGLDRPTAGGAYRHIAGQLFVGGAAYSDIKQGYLGDCYFMASLAETALRNPSVISNMFVVNGDGTYAVKFFNNGQSHYVTVDSYLPTDSGGRLIYANLGAAYNNSGNELWTALAEKAYVQINQMGWLRSGLPGNGQNSYAAIEGGYIYAALSQISGQATVAFASTAGTASFSTFVTAFNAGKSIGFASKSAPASSTVVGNHAYTVLSYNAANQTVTLYNPWGTSYALVTMTWSQIQGSFAYFDRTA